MRYLFKLKNIDFIIGEFMEETIVAIATAYGEAGIGIVRISGSEALNILKKIFKTKGDIVDRKLNYGHIVDPENDQKIDEVMAVFLAAPKTYTREDVVEIDCHGGIVPIRKILELCIKNGAKMADRGEFTKRAFLNGRLDLSEAEAVIDLIKSKTESGYALAQAQANGYLSKKIRKLRKKLMDLLVDMAVNIDYPDEDIEELTYEKLINSLKSINKDVSKMKDSAKTGKILREGLNVAIVGKPNVGKSSLLNLLLKEERAIVTDIAGTTRDTIEASISIDGIPINLIDTAGMRDTDDEIEKIGIYKSRKALEKAELVILMLDASRSLEEIDFNIMKELYKKETIIFFNKIDIPGAKLNHDDTLFLNFVNIRKIYGTVKRAEGIKQLAEEIKDVVYGGKVKVDSSDFIGNLRHEELLMATYKSLLDAIDSAKNREPLDLIEIDVKNAFEYLGDVIGENVSDDVINEVFSKFCLGK